MNPLKIFTVAPVVIVAALSAGLAAAGAEERQLAVAHTQQQQQLQQATTQDVGDPVVIRGHPQSLLLKAGELALFRVTGVRGNGSLPLFYQWRRNGIDIPGADKPWLKFGHVSLTDDGSRLTVLVSAGPASVESKPAALRVVSAATTFSDD